MIFFFPLKTEACQKLQLESNYHFKTLAQNLKNKIQ